MQRWQQKQVRDFLVHDVVVAAEAGRTPFLR